jgi:TctA family transporter
MKSAGEIIVAIVSGILGLAILAVVLSNNSNTTNVLSGFFSGLSNLITAAVKPVSGGSVL